MASSYVFISYSREDRGFVSRLAADLRGVGVATWTDLENISPGADWQKEIEGALLRAGVLLYVASENSVSSRWMDTELRAFLRGRGRIIPVVIDETGAERLPDPLRDIQWADFRTDYQEALRSLLDGIRTLQGATPIPEARQRSKGFVFISYAVEDAQFVAELRDFLKARGYAFFDFRVSQRNYQADYTLDLEERIREAAAVVSVISPDWKRSRDAMRELHFSIEVEKPVFLLRLRDPGPTLALAGMTHIDFTGSTAEGFATLAQELEQRRL